MKTTNRRNLFILVFALLVVMLGFGMIVPVFPFLIDKLGARRKIWKMPLKFTV